MIAEILDEEESRIRWSHDNGKTWHYADIDELIEAYEREQAHKREKEEGHTCEFCYYQDFDEDAYPCSRCICNEPTENKWTFYPEAQEHE